MAKKMEIIHHFLIKTEHEEKTIKNYALCILNYELSQRFHFCLSKAGCLRYLLDGISQLF